MFWNIFIFNKSKIYPTNIPKLIKHIKHIKTYQTYLSNTHQNKHVKVVLIFDPPKFSPVKITLKKVHQNDFHFSPIEITSNKARQRDAEFCLSKQNRKNLSKRLGNLLIFSFQWIDAISTTNRLQFNVLFLLVTQLFIVLPVVIKSSCLSH